ALTRSVTGLRRRDMKKISPAGIAAMLLAVAVLMARPAFAQQQASAPPPARSPVIETAPGDIVGFWDNVFHEDFWERRSGLQVGDFTGLPLNEAGKLGAMSWDPGWFSIPEEQCRPHTGLYAPRGPWSVLIEAEYDQNTQRLVAYHLYGGISSRTIWMDGRPHPPEWAKHTYAGFSTGVWEGDTLVVRTTHTKAGYLQRNGAPHSDQIEGLEYWRRQGDSLLLTSFVQDPQYLAEPLIRTTNWFKDPNPAAGRAAIPSCTPFEVVDESIGRDKHKVPHFLPGQYDQAREFQVSKGIPPEAAEGGAETLYPEYIPKLQKMRAEYMAKITANRPKLLPGQGQPGFIGYWSLNRGKSTYNVSWNRVNLDNRDGSAPEKRLITIEPVTGGSLKQTTDTQVVANDTGVHRQEVTFKVDGKDYETRGGAIETWALKQVDANTFERTGKIKGQVVETATYRLSPDGKQLTITSKGQIGQDKWEDVQVFERQ
ncbi:MAG TPA: hypothetical protein VGQ19_11355, partial [Burkholderiales bacterium]|nr:hypothetical protein [Burkholderiales bacterium]